MSVAVRSFSLNGLTIGMGGFCSWNDFSYSINKSKAFTETEFLGDCYWTNDINDIISNS